MLTRAMNVDGTEDVGSLHVVSGANEIYSINGDERILVNKKVVLNNEVVEHDQKGLAKNDYSCTRTTTICCSDESSSSSSIGKNSDLSENNNSNEKQPGGHEEEEEVESSYKGPFDAMKALEEVLPIRRGISIYYNGKSKSFASLADAAASSSSSSIKDIAKPENAYVMRRRRNLLAWDKIRISPLCGVSSMRPNKTTLALALAMSSNKSSEHEMMRIKCHTDNVTWSIDHY